LYLFKIRHSRERYNTELHTWAIQNDVRLPSIPAECEQTYHMFYILMPSLDSRQALIEHLKSNGILAVFHYLPLHLSDMGRGFGGQTGDCPVTEDLSDRLLRLPFYNSMTHDEQTRVIACLMQFS